MLYGDEKLSLTAAYCNPLEDLKEMHPDLDGFVVILDKFASLKVQLSYLNLKARIASVTMIVKKTTYRGKLKWGMNLTNMNRTNISLMSDEPEGLRRFRSAFEKAIDLYLSTEKRETVRHNDVESGFIQVYESDSEFIKVVLDEALAHVKTKYPRVSECIFLVNTTLTKVYISRT